MEVFICLFCFIFGVQLKQATYKILSDSWHETNWTKYNNSNE